MEKNHLQKTLKVFLVLAIFLVSVYIASAAQCNDGVDNDGDGKIDALVELNPNNNEVKIWTKDPFGIRDFVNQKGLQHIPDVYAGAGALNYDSTTAKFICNLAGYSNVKSYDCVSTYDWGRCGWYSCGDNVLAKYNPTKGDFDIQNACTLGNKWISSLTCEDRIPACSDGIDNDGDGKVDMADDGCASPNDDSEIPHDPNCDSPTDDSEAPECSDGVDNDNDKVIDSEDPGCWDDITDPNTYNPTLDDESRADPECITSTDCGDNYYTNNYCSNGDVYHDYHAFTCSIGMCDEDIVTEKVADCDNGCQNGICLQVTQPECDDNIDNDLDGYIDELDPGCWNDPTDPNTYNPTLDDEGRYDYTECIDKIDNDLDSVIDEMDPGCWDDPTDPSTFNPELDNEGLYDPMCTQDSDCPDDVILGTTCHLDNVYDLVLHSTCQGAGTGTSTCVGSTILVLNEECPNGCSNGQCIQNECNSDSDCSDDYYSETYCGDYDDVYQDFHDFSCDDGTCSEEVTSEVTDICYYGCEEGACLDECSVDSECGEDYYSQNYCFNGGVYRDFHDFSCDGECNEDTQRQLVQDCLGDCINGACQDLPACSDGIDNDGDGLTDLNDPGCDNPTGGSEVDCSTDLDCGIDAFILGSESCTGNDLYADHSYHSCENAGQNSAYCQVDIFKTLKQDCGDDVCTTSAPYCSSGSVYATKYSTERSCSNDACTSQQTQTAVLVTQCENGCRNGQCNTITDQSGPQITLLTPENDQTVSGDVQFNYTASDTSGVKNCSLIVDGTNVSNDFVIDSTEINTFVESNLELGSHTAKVACYDYGNNYEESNSVTFNYGESSCTQTSDCGTVSEELICDGDDVVRERTEPSCSVLGVCETNVTYEFVKSCSNGCSNGHCKTRGGGSSNKDSCDDDCSVPIIVSTTPLTNSTTQDTIVIESAPTVLNSNNIPEKESGINWMYILVFLLIIGIIFLIILIIMSIA